MPQGRGKPSKKSPRKKNTACSCSNLSKENYYCGSDYCPNCQLEIDRYSKQYRKDFHGPDGVVFNKGGGSINEEATLSRRIFIMTDSHGELGRLSISALAEVAKARPDIPKAEFPRYFNDYYEDRAKLLAEQKKRDISSETQEGAVLLDEPLRVKSDAPLDKDAVRREGESLADYKSRRNL